MKKRLASFGLPFSLISAVVCLTIRVGRTELGGIVGTMVVQPNTSDDAIAQTTSMFRVCGIMWLGLAALCIKYLIQKSDDS
jgi:hypothetical protein